MAAFVFNSDAGTLTGTIPQAKGYVRAYFVYPTASGYRMQGQDRLPLLLAESVSPARSYPKRMRRQLMQDPWPPSIQMTRG